MSNSKYLFEDRDVLELSAVEMAYTIFEQSKDNFVFKNLANEIVELKGIPSERLADLYSQLYTQMNIDGRFIHLGGNEWGLKAWYPTGKAEELLTAKDYTDEFSDADDEVEEELELEVETEATDSDAEEVDDIDNTEFFDDELGSDDDGENVEDEEEL